MSKALRLKDLVVYEDRHVLAINKPANIASLHERFDSEQPSIIALCKAENPNYSLCHRLDRETSGIMLIAKDADTYGFIARQFEARSIRKTYHAVVAASVKLDNLMVDLPLYTDSKRRVQISRKEGKPSETLFSTLKQYAHFTLLACSPLSGRLHQIRVHAASQNLPLLADELYGGKPAYLAQIKRKLKNPEDAEKTLIKRVALHAYSIEFDSPEKGRITVSAPYPKDFEVLVKLLDKYDTIA